MYFQGNIHRKKGNNDLFMGINGYTICYMVREMKVK